MSSSVVFVDKRLPNYLRLGESLSTTAEVFFLDVTQDALEPMARYLSARSSVSAFYLVSRGDPGTATIGGTQPTLSALPLYGSKLARIGSVLSEEGDIFLYGCNIGVGTIGDELLSQIAAASAPDVGGSDGQGSVVVVTDHGVAPLVDNLTTMTKPLLTIEPQSANEVSDFIEQTTALIVPDSSQCTVLVGLDRDDRVASPTVAADHSETGPSPSDAVGLSFGAPRLGFETTAEAQPESAGIGRPSVQYPDIVALVDLYPVPYIPGWDLVDQLATTPGATVRTNIDFWERNIDYIEWSLRFNYLYGQVYISDDNVIDTSDRPLQEIRIWAPILHQGGVSGGSFDVDIPSDLSPGTWYLGVIADYSVDPAHRNTMIETDETNNTDYVTLIIRDVDPPSRVSNLRTDALNGWTKDKAPTFLWGDATDNIGVKGYEWRLNQGNIVYLANSFFGESVTLPDLAEGSYQFQVRAVDSSDNRGAWTSLDFGVDSTPPGPVTLLAPPGGSRSDPRPVFSWAAAGDGSGSGVAFYDLDVYDKDITWGDLSESVIGTSFAPADDIPPDAVYWRVRAVDVAGNAGPWSPERDLIVLPEGQHPGDIDWRGTEGVDVYHGTSYADLGIDGLGGNDSLYGEAGDDELLGNVGDDSLCGGPGSDTMAGGAGNDSYSVDSFMDVVMEAVDQGRDRVESSVSYVLPDNVEDLTLLEGGGAHFGTGNSLNNTIRGNSASNDLSGDGGDDLLYGGGGSDTLVGGDGRDETGLGQLPTLTSVKVNPESVWGTRNDGYNVIRFSDVNGPQSYRVTPTDGGIILESLGSPVTQELRGVEYLRFEGPANTVSVPLHSYRVVINRRPNGTGDATFYRDGVQKAYVASTAGPDVNVGTQSIAFAWDDLTPIGSGTYEAVYRTDGTTAKHYEDFDGNVDFDGSIQYADFELLDVTDQSGTLTRTAIQFHLGQRTHSSTGCFASDVFMDEVRQIINQDLGAFGDKSYWQDYHTLDFVPLPVSIMVEVNDPIDQPKLRIDPTVTVGDEPGEYLVRMYYSSGRSYSKEVYVTLSCENSSDFNVPAGVWLSAGESEVRFSVYRSAGSSATLLNLIIGDGDREVNDGDIMAFRVTSQGVSQSVDVTRHLREATDRMQINTDAAQPLAPSSTPNEQGGIDIVAPSATQLTPDLGTPQPDNAVVFAGATIIMPSQVENLTVNTGSGALVNGNDLANRIRGDIGDDALLGLAGDDWLSGRRGDDSLYGGAGGDFLDGGEGEDHLAGEAGNDQLIGGDGQDVLEGGEGDDVVIGGAGLDVLKGGPGADRFIGTPEDLQGDRLQDFTGDDVIEVSYARFGNTQLSVVAIAGGVRLDLDTDNDAIPDTNISLVGEFTRKAFVATPKDGTLEAGTAITVFGPKTETGTSEDDLLAGTLFADILDGAPGNDTILGADGDDTLTGGDGNDSLDGGPGDDKIDGGAGTDSAVFNGAMGGYRIGTMPDGTVFVTDVDNTDGRDGVDIVSGVRTLEFSDGSITVRPPIGEFRVNTYASGKYFWPTLAAAALQDGGFIVVWESDRRVTGNDAWNIDIFAQRFDAAGEAIGYERLISTSARGGYNAIQPSVAGLSDGGYVVTWEDFDIRARRYDYSDDSIGDEFSVDNPHYFDATDSNVTAIGDHGFVVVWAAQGMTQGSRDLFSFDIHSRNYDASGQFRTYDFPVNVDEPDFQHAPSVSSLTGGGYVIAWESFVGGSPRNGIYARKYYDSGWPTGDQFLVVGNSNGIRDPDIIGLRDGSFVVCWSNDFFDGNGPDVYAQRFQADGSPIGSVFQVNTNITRGGSPKVAALSNGGFVVTWNSLGDVYGQLYNSSGQVLDAEFRVNTFTATYLHSDVVGLKDGGFLVVWSPRGQDGTVYARRYDATGHALNSPLTLTGTFSNDDIIADNGDQALFGVFGNDVLAGGAGNDTIDGGDGSDTASYHCATSAVTVNLDLAGPQDVGGDGIDALLNIENLIGSGFGDALIGNAGSNTLDGGDGNDRLDAAAGNDTINGGAGNDTLVGGPGTDLADYTTATAGVTVDLTLSFAQDTRADSGLDILTEIEGVIGSAFADTLSGNGSDNVLFGGAGDDSLSGQSGCDEIDGGAGNDSIDGGDGTDLLRGDDGSDTYYVDDPGDVIIETNADAHSGGTDYVYSTSDYTLAANVERLRIIGAGALNGSGNSGDNILYAGSGDNVLDGSAGADVVSYAFAAAAVSVSLDSTAAQATGGSGSDTLINVENLTGSPFDDALTGDDSGNALDGDDGNDRLFGRAGDDILRGGTGSDRLNGGPGDDTLDGGSGNDLGDYATVTAGVTVDLTISVAQDTGADSGLDTLVDIEGVVGSAFADTLSGSGSDNKLFGDAGDDSLSGRSGTDELDGGAGNDSLDGGEGADRLRGGDGSDTYYVDDPGDVIIETDVDADSGGTDHVYSIIDYALAANVENLRILGAGALNGRGNSGDNILYSGSGDNLLDGSAGTDTVSYAYAAAAVSVSLTSAAAQATGGSGSDRLLDIENLNGSPFDDTLTGNDHENTLDGGAGADSLSGGDGSDIYYVDHTADVVIETNAIISNGGTDCIYSSIDYTLGSNVENLGLLGTNAISGWGNGLANVLYSGDGDNVLDGRAGNDSASYTYADAAVRVSLATTAAQATRGSSSDTLLNIENVTGSRYNDVLEGNDEDNVLDGGAGNDILIGGRGNDVYIIDGIEDRLVEVYRPQVVSIAGDWTPSNASSPSLFTDGNHVQFLSQVDNERELFVKDLRTEETKRVGDLDRSDYFDSGVRPGMSSDGRFRVFASSDGSLVADDTNGCSDVFLEDGVAGVTTRVSIGLNSVESNGPSTDPSISADGRYLAFLSQADNLVTGDTNGVPDVFVKDLRTGVTERISTSSTGEQDNEWSYTPPQISANGRYVAFVSFGSNLVAGDSNYSFDVFVKDLLTGTTTRASTRKDGLQAFGHSYYPSISADGRYVAFSSLAENLVSGDENGESDIFVKDTWTGEISRITSEDAGEQEGLSCFQPSISGDGRYVAFEIDNGAGWRVVGVVPVSASAEEGGMDTIRTSASHTLGLGLENLVLSADADIDGTGNDLDNVLYSGRGSNVLDGRGGRDTASYAYASGGIDVSLRVIGAQATGGSGSDTLLNIENLAGSPHDDKLTGNDEENILDGGAGEDTMTGGDGSDTYYVDNAGDLVVETNGTAAGGTMDSVLASVDHTLAPNVEVLRMLGSGALSGTGNSLDNLIYPGNGSNILDGGAGIDTVSYTYARNAVRAALEAEDTPGIVGSDIDELINIENLVGSSYDDMLIGSSLDNRLDGGAGGDFMQGGDGSDTYYVDNLGDMVSESNDALIAGGFDTVRAHLSYTLGSNVEALWLLGDGEIDGTGNTLDNILIAGNGDNILDGQAGRDAVSYSHAAGAVSVSLELTGAQPTGGSGSDTLLNIEDLSGSQFADTLVGNSGDNLLDGGPGADVLIGGAGNDVYVVDTAEDQVREFVASLQAVSSSAAGLRSNDHSNSPSMSADGRYVAFTSRASNLVATDTNASDDVFVKDMLAGAVSRVSTDSSGAQANDSSFNGRLSADGRYVAFYSRASNLVPNDTNGYSDCFVKDVWTGQTTRVSTNSHGNQSLGAYGTSAPSLSADGRYVAFVSGADNLVNGDSNGALDVFVKDRDSGVTARVSTGTDSIEGNSGSYNPCLSADGRYVLFCSMASNLAAGDVNGVVDVFVKDLVTGITTCASANDFGVGSNNWSGGASLSANGRYVAFYSRGSNLVPGDTNGAVDVFFKDLQTGIMTRISTDSAGGQANGDINLPQGSPSLSTDGRYVAFESAASNLVVGDKNDLGDIFVKDLQTSETRLVSANGAGEPGNSESQRPSISGNGSLVTFDSAATNMIAGDVVRRIGQVLMAPVPGTALDQDHDTVHSSVSYGLGSGIENLVLMGGGNINAVGNSLDNTLFAGSGDNVLDGGTGNDSVSYANATGAVSVSLGMVGAQDTGSSGNDTLTSIENLSGSPFSDTLSGDVNANRINGDSGDDTLLGGSGNDTLSGGIGEDVFLFSERGNGVDTILDFGVVDRITIVGATLLAGIERGNGTTIAEGQVQLAAGGVGTILFIGTDAVPGAELEIRLSGNYLPTQLISAGSSITHEAADNSAPDGADKTVTMIEDSSYVLSSADFGYSDPDDTPPNALLAVRISTLPAAGGLTLSGTAASIGQAITVADLDEGHLVFAPAANASGNAYASFSFQVQDDGGIANGGIDLDPTPNTISVDVSRVNDAPSGSDQTVSTREDSAYALSPTDFGFRDPDDTSANALFAVRITTLPGAGTLTLAGNAASAGQIIPASDLAAGNLVFTPDGNAIGTGYASFSFQVQDDGGTANGGADLDPTPNTMTIDVAPVSDAPSGADDTVVTSEDNAYLFALADFGFSDPEDIPANALFAVRITMLPGAGTLTLAGNAVSAGHIIPASDLAAGNLVFTPDGNATGSGYASFSFQVQDDGGIVNGGMDLDPTPNRMTIDVRPLTGTDGDDTLVGGEHDNLLDGRGGNDLLHGRGGNDTVLGGSDADTLDGGAGADVMDGGDGSDNYTVDDSGDLVIESNADRTSGGNDSVASSLSGYTLPDHVENLRLLGSANLAGSGNAGDNVLIGNAGANFLDGAGGDDALEGGWGGDTLDGGAGADTLTGGAGDDVYAVETTSDEIVEALGGGTDTIRSSVNFTLETLPHVENVTLLGLGNLTATGNEGNNIVSGNVANNVLDGGEGSDTLSGGYGTDTLTGNDGDDWLYGNQDDDQLSGDAGNDWLHGGKGDDTLAGGADNDTLAGGLGDDLVQGGAGIDTVDYSTSTDAVTVSLATAVAQLVSASQGSDTLTEVENLSGSAYGDTLTGNGSANLLAGVAGNDTLTGDYGNDTLNGGDGDDWLYGNQDNDQLSGEAGNDWLHGGKGNDTLTGGAANDTLAGGLGDDLLQGGAGIDTADYSTSTDAVAVSLANAGAQAVSASQGSDTLSEIENLSGSAYGDALTGNGGANVLAGLAGNDTLTGDYGNDTLNGGEGDDWLYGNQDHDQLSGDAGNDWLHGGQGNDTLAGAAGNDTLAGGVGNDTLTGGAEADRFRFDTLLDALTNLDTITDHITGEDTLELENAIFTSLAPGSLDPTSLRAAAHASSAADANDTLIYDTFSGALYYDAEGDSGAGPVQFATLSGAPALSSLDFVVT